MKAVVVGLGQFGQASALALAKSGVHVVAVDVDMKLVDHIKADVAMAVAADASDKASLEALDVADADVLIAAIGEDFEAQLLVVVHARELGIQHIVARSGSDTHAKILREIGAHDVMNPEEASAQHLVRAIMMPGAKSSFALASGFSVVKMDVPEKIIGANLRDLDLRRNFRLNVVAIEIEGDDGNVCFDPVPDPERGLEAGDVLTLVGSDLDIARFSDVQG